MFSFTDSCGETARLLANNLTHDCVEYGEMSKAF
jgi:hypothetical protein